MLCTDDSSIFSTNLSREYAIGMSTFSLGRPAMQLLARKALNYIFLSQRCQAALGNAVRPED